MPEGLVELRPIAIRRHIGLGADLADYLKSQRRLAVGRLHVGQARESPFVRLLLPNLALVGDPAEAVWPRPPACSVPKGAIALEDWDGVKQRLRRSPVWRAEAMDGPNVFSSEGIQQHCRRTES